jgi:hypothetical protein
MSPRRTRPRRKFIRSSQPATPEPQPAPTYEAMAQSLVRRRLATRRILESSRWSDTDTPTRPGRNHTRES